MVGDQSHERYHRLASLVYKSNRRKDTEDFNMVSAVAGQQRHHPRVSDDHRHWAEPASRALRQPRLPPFGGRDGAPREIVINPGTPRENRRLKTNRMPLREGDTVRCYTGGGEGYGNPLDRDPQADGNITPTYASWPWSAALLIILRMAPSSLGTARANNASPLADTAQA